MSSRFENLINEIAENTKFIRLDMIPYFKEYLNRHQNPLNKIRRAFKISRSRQSSRLTKSNVAAYLKIKGIDLLFNWLNLLFHFRRTDLNINLKKGGTSMDAIMLINYNYNQNELIYIKKVINDYNLKENDISIGDISLLLLGESVLCMEKTFNEIIGYKFSLMMQNDEIEILKNEIKVSIEVVTRLFS